MSNTTKQSLPLEEYYDEAYNYMKEALGDIRFKASRANGKNIRIGTILTPAHFTYEMRRLVSSSWQTVNDGVFGWPVRPVSYASVVYPDNDCVDRLYNPILPQGQGEWVLMFHQDFNYLSISLSMITTYVDETTSQEIPISTPAFAEDIVTFLQFTDEHEDHPNITSIVLSSNDNNTVFQVVRKALDIFNVQLWNRRKVPPLELKYMAAIGAACMARQHAIFLMEDAGCEYRFIDDEEPTAAILHVEL